MSVVGDRNSDVGDGDGEAGVVVAVLFSGG